MRSEADTETIEARFLGGFELTRGGQPLRGFESRKVRALLAYLMIGTDEGGVSRDRLSALLWPEESEERSRQNLRQALYNLRKTLAATGRVAPLETDRHTVCWITTSYLTCDVHSFEKAVAVGLDGTGCVDAGVLENASRLYRGLLLDGLFVDDSPEYESWLLFEQEHLRDLALTVERALSEFYASRGELSQAIEHGRRWVELDPLSEEAHRALMRQQASAGQRGRALAQYEHCKHLVNLEMGVEPLAETTALYESILAEEYETAATVEGTEPTGAVLPMVGRRTAYSQLREAFAEVIENRARTTFVQGPEGVGKTRLVKSFIHDAASQAVVPVLIARGRVTPIARAYHLLEDMVRCAMDCVDRAADVLSSGVASGVLDPLIDAVPALNRALAEDRSPNQIRLDKLADATAAFLSAVAEASEDDASARGVIVFVDDLQWADAASVRLLREVADRVRQLPVWFVAAFRSEEIDHEGPLARWIADEPGIRVVELESLDGEAVLQLAQFLVGADQAPALADYLCKRSHGVPLAVAEWVNLLYDDGLLVRREDGMWRLAEDFDGTQTPPAADLGELVMRRVQKLPASTRRLLVLAGVIGQTFDAELLRDAGEEHETVLEVSIEILLQRWLARHSPRCWFASRRERDIVAWSRGARRGRFEFAHKAIRRELLAAVDGERHVLMHRQAAEALDRRADREVTFEEQAWHWLACREWELALACLENAARRAERLDAEDVASALAEQAFKAIENLEDVSKTLRNRWLKRQRTGAREVSESPAGP